MKGDLSIRRTCALLGIPRSTYYARRKRPPALARMAAVGLVMMAEKIATTMRLTYAVGAVFIAIGLVYFAGFDFEA